mgnify:FL=1
MAILRQIFIIIFTFLVVGCTETFDPKIDTEPVLCINSLITAGQPIEVRVTHTWMFNDVKGDSIHDVRDARIYIYANGEQVMEDYIPQEGDNIRIVAQSNKYGEAEASVSVPRAVPISLVEFTPEMTYWYKDSTEEMLESVNFNLKVLLKIEDIYSTDDLFHLGFNYLFPPGVIGGDGVYDSWEDTDQPHVALSLWNLKGNAEPLFKECLSLSDYTVGADDEDLPLVFSDRQFSLHEYTLTLQFGSGMYRVEAPEFDSNLYDCKVEFSISTISRSYYDRAIYVWQRDAGWIGDLSDIGFAEPMWGYSNVSTGAGVVAARAVSTITVSFKDFLERTLHDDRPGGKCRR